MEGLPEFPGEEEKIDAEVDAEEGHKDRADALKIGAVPRHGVVFDAESACACGAEGSAQAVEQRHSSRQKKTHAQNGEGHVDEIEDGCGLPDLGDQPAHAGAGALRPEQVDAVSPFSHGHHGQKKDQDAHAAQPVGKAPPEEESPTHGLHIPENGGTRGGEAGGHFKEGVHIVGDLPGQPEWERSRCGEDQPAQRDDEKALPGVEAELSLPAEEPGQPACAAAEQHGGEDGPQRPAFSVSRGDHGRGEEKETFQKKKDAQHLSDHFSIHVPVSILSNVSPQRDLPAVLPFGRPQ